MSSTFQGSLKLIRRHVNYGKRQPFSRSSSFRYLSLIGSPAGYFVGGKTFLRCRECVGLFTARIRRERRVRKHGYDQPLGPSASLCSLRARARRGGGGGGAAGVRSEGRGRRARARRRGVGPPRPRPFPRTDPVAPRARTLASPGDMQMRYPRGGGPGRGEGSGGRGGPGPRAPGAHPPHLLLLPRSLRRALRPSA